MAGIEITVITHVFSTRTLFDKNTRTGAYLPLDPNVKNPKNHTAISHVLICLLNSKEFYFLVTLTCIKVSLDIVVKPPKSEYGKTKFPDI